MAMVIGVRFKKAGKVYYFDPCDIWPRPGSNVVVETARGVEFGEVVTGAREISDEQIVTPLKKVLRLATEEDERRAAYNAQREKDAFSVCQEKIAKHKLDMKLVSVEYTFDNSKIIFYFTANGRVDFRELVKDLAGVFKMRIELRQIGVRDEAKMLGGLGACGRPICCGAFLGDFQPVSIKMAKEQNLSLSPTKISGLCGRLMCCLQYEESAYEQMRKLMPKVGKEIETPDGVGVTVENNVITEKTKVRITAEDGSFEIKEYPYAILGPGAAQRQKEAEAADQATAGEEALPPKPAPVLPPRQRNDRRSDRPQGNRKPQGDKPREEKPREEAAGRSVLPGESLSGRTVLPGESLSGSTVAGDKPASVPQNGGQRRNNRRPQGNNRRPQGQGARPQEDKPAQGNRKPQPQKDKPQENGQQPAPGAEGEAPKKKRRPYYRKGGKPGGQDKPRQPQA